MNVEEFVLSMMRVVSRRIFYLFEAYIRRCTDLLGWQWEKKLLVESYNFQDLQQKKKTKLKFIITKNKFNPRGKNAANE